MGGKSFFAHYYQNLVSEKTSQKVLTIGVFKFSVQ